MERMSPVASPMDQHNSNGIGHALDRPVSDVLSRKPPRRVIEVEPLLTAEEVAEWLHYSVDWVWDHSSRKKPLLPFIRMSDGSLRYRASAIEAFIDERERISAIRRRAG
jgi:predicted DNA-binding transcriptional regulator AlpA